MVLEAAVEQQAVPAAQRAAVMAGRPRAAAMAGVERAVHASVHRRYCFCKSEASGDLHNKNQAIRKHQHPKSTVSTKHHNHIQVAQQ
jgi:hypothetical protein